MGRAALRGSTVAVMSAFPAAAITALVYRFPVPLAEEYARGPSGVVIAAVAAVFYLLLGGLVVLGVLGAGVGLLAAWIGSPDDVRVRRLTVLLAAIVALAGALFLAVLENFIGPW